MGHEWPQVHLPQTLKHTAVLHPSQEHLSPSILRDPVEHFSTKLFANVVHHTQ